MKLIGRTLVILLAALLVVGAAVGFAQSSYAASLVPTVPAGERGAAPPSFNSTVDAPDATATGASAQPVFDAGESRPEGGNAGGFFSAVAMVKNLGIMGLIVGVVVLAPSRHPAIAPAQVYSRVARGHSPDRQAVRSGHLEPR